jgi:hypothetical protein
MGKRMAIFLKDICIIVPLRHLSFQGHGPVGFIASNVWYDHSLYCEVVGNVTKLGARILEWERRGVESIDRESSARHWRNLCIASAGFGLHGPCDWLEYDPATETVWLKDSEKGDAFGGHDQYLEFRRKLDVARVAAEQSYTQMYNSQFPKDDRDDALGHLSEAIRMAKLLNVETEIVELEARYESISAAYGSQFKS